VSSGAVTCQECRGMGTIINPHPTRTQPEIVCPSCGGYGTSSFKEFKPHRWERDGS